MDSPLSHIKVVEMTVAIQGPGAGVFLRDMGADVIKIESPLGDPSRTLRGVDNALPPETLGAQFVAMNRGKRSVCLDANSPLGHQAILQLLRGADVFVSNFRPAGLKKMGLDYETVHGLYPGLVYATANGFGPLGPDADKFMLDGAAVARGGLASMTGTTNSGPITPGAAVADTAGAMQLALAVVTALLARTRDGIGQHVQSSALGAQLWLQQWELTHVWMTGNRLERSGAHLANLRGPYGIYETSDGGHFLIALAKSNECWDEFWIFAEQPEQTLDPMWNTPGKRIGVEENGASKEDAIDIQARIRAAVKRYTTAEWDAFLSTQPDMIYERVRNYDEVREDPQNAANGYVETMDLASIGPRAVVGNLLRFSHTPAATRGGPPELGADTVAALCEAGVPEADIESIVEHATQVREEAIAEFLAQSEGDNL